MANQADVRVRLSAEGQAEVIAAFQKIASEGKKSGKETGEAFKELNAQFAEVGKNLIGGLGVVLLADKFKEFFKSTLEGAENMTRLSAQTGITTGTIQAMGRAARETGVSQETVNAGLVKFTAAVGKAEIGSKQSATALSDLGISVREFQKLTPDQQLQLVAERLAQIAEPARRARDEVALFGRAGVELDQTLVKVGQEGFAPFIKHLQDIGIFLDAETIESLKHSAESFKDLSDTVKGVATQFLTGLVPALQKTTDELVRATNAAGGASKSLGSYLGDALSGLGDFVIDAGKQFGALTFITARLFGAVKAALNDLVHGNIEKAKSEFGKFREEYNQLERDFLADRAARGARLAAPPTPSPESPAGGDGGAAAGAQATALAKAKLALLDAHLTNELKLYTAHAALLEAADKQMYETGQISLTEYYSRRAAIITGELDKEIAIARAKRAAEAAQKVDINDPVGEINQRTQLLKLDGEIQLLELKRTSELAANTRAQADAQARLYADTLKNEERLLTIAGKKTEAARLKLALELADLDAQLRKAGTSDTDRASAEGTFAGQGAAQIDFGAASQKAQADLASLESARKAIDNQVRSGELFSIDAAQKIVLLDQQRLPALKADAEAMLELAKATGDALNVERAQAYKDKIDQIAASTNQLGIQTAQVKQGVENAIGSGINKFLTDASKGTKSLKQDFTDMALSIVGDIEKIAIKLLEEEALKALFGSATGGGSGGGGAAGGLLAGFAGALAGGLAEGGQVRGPGTSKSDSIPAMLSDREFVVNADATQRPGVLPLLSALNGGALKGVHGPTTVPKFAAGGQVGGGSSAPVIKLVNVMDPTALGDHLATAAGERSVLNVISRNPSRVRGYLG